MYVFGIIILLVALSFDAAFTNQLTLPPTLQPVIANCEVSGPTNQRLIVPKGTIYSLQREELLFKCEIPFIAVLARELCSANHEIHTAAGRSAHATILVIHEPV